MACFDPIKATSRRNDDPAHASRPVRPRPRRLRDGRGRRGPDPGGARARARARGAHVYCEVAGFASRGNAFHMTGLQPDGVGDGRGDHRRAAPGRHRARRHRLHQRARLGHQAERPPRDGGLQAVARRARLQGADQLDQVDDRALARRASARSRWPPARWRSTAASCRRRRTGRTATRSATSTTRPTRRAGSTSTSRSRRAAASAASSRR